VGNPRAGPSRVPRVSGYGAGTGGTGYQSFAMGAMGGGGKRMSFVGTGMGTDEKSNSLTMGLTDKEIDERVCLRISRSS
jgi:kinesin family protein 22